MSYMAQAYLLRHITSPIDLATTVYFINIPFEAQAC